MFSQKQRTVLFLMFCIHFLMIVDFMIIMPMAPHIMNLFSVDTKQFSILVTTFTLAAGLIGIFCSFFLDRFDRRKTLLLVTVGFMLGNTACALSNEFWQLVVARGFTGAFVGVIGSLILAIVSDVIEVEKRGKAIGIVMSAFAVASIVGVPLCLLLYQKTNWSMPFWSLSALSLIFLGAVFFYLPGLNTKLDKSKYFFLKTKNQKFSVLFIILLILGHFSINPFLFVSLIQNAKIPESSLTMVYLCAGFGSILSSLVSGYLVDKLGFKKVFTFSLIISLFCIYWVTQFKSSQLFWATACVTAFFVFMGARMTAAMTWITAQSGMEGRGSFMSLINSFQHLSAALAALVAGHIVLKTESGEILHFEQVGYFAIALSLFALFIPLNIESDLNP